MMILYPDIPTSRRKHLHYVLDDDETLMFSAAKMTHVIDWLFENGHLEFEVKTEHNRFTMVLVRIGD